LATAWPLFYGLDFLKQNAAVVGIWIAASLAMSTFTLLPVVNVENLDQM
jgi:GPI ethanolamine phosphate transferase 1